MANNNITTVELKAIQDIDRGIRHKYLIGVAFGVLSLLAYVVTHDTVLAGEIASMGVISHGVVGFGGD